MNFNKEKDRLFLHEHFKKLGIVKNDNLLIYSNLSAFGIINKKLPLIIYKILRKIIGKKGTIVVPLYNFNTENTKFYNPNKIYENYSTSTFSKFIFSLKKKITSKSIIHRHVSIGKNAKILKITKDFISFGKNSDFEIMKKLNFKCIFLGCDAQQGGTFFFFIESCYRVPHRAWVYLNRKILLKDSLKNIKFRYYSLVKRNIKYDLNKAFFKLKKLGADIKSADLKYGASFSILLKDFYKFGTIILKKDINGFLKK